MRALLRPVTFSLGVTLALFAAAACGGPTVDLATGLEVLEVTTGWHDEGIVDGQNKLVPRVDFKLKNVSDQPLVALQVNCVFRRLGETEELGSGFVWVTRGDALDPGETTPPLSIRSNFGYKGDEPRADMLKNSHFVDAKVDMMAKYASLQWKKIREFPIERLLLTK
jgi:hypothetical protein